MVKAKFEAFVSGAGKTAKELLDSAVQVADQNDDGKFDFEDVSVIAETVDSTVKKGIQEMKETADEIKRQKELKILQPIFSAVDIKMPKFIRITDREKRYIDSEVCQGAIGYQSDYKNFHIVNIFRESVEAFNLTFIPNDEYEFYYADPGKENTYIALEKYFNHLKIMRVNELQKIAQDLGAKSFKVIYKEEQISFSAKKVKINAKAAGVGTATANHNTDEKQYENLKIEATMKFQGHEPVKPQLKYLKNDPSIQHLIEMRMDKNGAVLQHKYELNMSDSLGMNEQDAIKIDAVLKGLKCSCNATVESEVKNESRRCLEYNIEF